MFDGFWDTTLETVPDYPGQWPVVPPQYTVTHRERGEGKYGELHIGNNRQIVVWYVRAIGGGVHRFAVKGVGFVIPSQWLASTTMAAEKLAVGPAGDGSHDYWRVWGTGPGIGVSGNQQLNVVVVQPSRFGAGGMDATIIPHDVSGNLTVSAGNPWLIGPYTITQVRWALPADFSSVLSTALE